MREDNNVPTELDRPGKIIVSGIPEDSSFGDASLEKEFAPFGRITEAYIVKDRKTNKNRGFAFITYENPQDSKDAIKAMEGKDLGGTKPLHCEQAKIGHKKMKQMHEETMGGGRGGPRGGGRGMDRGGGFRGRGGFPPRGMGGDRGGFRGRGGMRGRGDGFRGRGDERGGFRGRGGRGRGGWGEEGPRFDRGGYYPEQGHREDYYEEGVGYEAEWGAEEGYGYQDESRALLPHPGRGRGGPPRGRGGPPRGRGGPGGPMPPRGRGAPRGRGGYPPRQGEEYYGEEYQGNGYYGEGESAEASGYYAEERDPYQEGYGAEYYPPERPQEGARRGGGPARGRGAGYPSGELMARGGGMAREGRGGAEMGNGRGRAMVGAGGDRGYASRGGREGQGGPRRPAPGQEFDDYGYPVENRQRAPPSQGQAPGRAAPSQGGYYDDPYAETEDYGHQGAADPYRGRQVAAASAHHPSSRPMAREAAPPSQRPHGPTSDPYAEEGMRRRPTDGYPPSERYPEQSPAARRAPPASSRGGPPMSEAESQRYPSESAPPSMRAPAGGPYGEADPTGYGRGAAPVRRPDMEHRRREEAYAEYSRARAADSDVYVSYPSRATVDQRASDPYGRKRDAGAPPSRDYDDYRARPMPGASDSPPMKRERLERDYASYGRPEGVYRDF